MSCAILLIGRRNRPERSPHTANTTNYDVNYETQLRFIIHVIVLLYSRVLRLDARAACCLGEARLYGYL